MPRRASIGEKRTAAVHAARGDVILHWDDDDFHAPKRVSAQVAPIARGDVELTALRALVRRHASTTSRCTRWPSNRDEVILWSSLAYRSSLARELGFANVSLGEDIHFADRAVRDCHRMEIVSGAQSIYTRHEGVGVATPTASSMCAGMLQAPRCCALRAARVADA